MSRIPTIDEQRLANLKPAGLDEDFLARLAASAEGNYADLSADEKAFENELFVMRPAPVPSGLSDLLLDTLREAPFAVDGKIVLFNKPVSGSVAAGRQRRVFPTSLAAAAAVALLGAVAALMVPAEAPDDQAGAGPVPPPFNDPVASPVGFHRNLSDTRDEGVVWRGKNQPHRVLRLTYTDHVTVEDADGNPVRTERPRVEYMIIPEKID